MYTTYLNAILNHSPCSMCSSDVSLLVYKLTVYIILIPQRREAGHRQDFKKFLQLTIFNDTFVLPYLCSTEVSSGLSSFLPPPNNLG